MSKRIVFFNHKGGVSKTTSVYNLGWALAKEHKVLLVDADSQCNLSNLILGDNFEKYYLDESTMKNNIKDGVSPAFTGKPIPIQAVNCYSPVRAPSLFLLAGHADLSEYEASLSFAQTASNAIETLQNLPGAFSELIRLTEKKYSIDFTIIDLNPSLSSINQNLFLLSNGFIVPTNPDPFSIMAIKTLNKILPKWVEWKKSNMELFSESAYPLTPNIPKFLGTLIQRFNIRKGRAAKPYRDNIDEIKERIKNDFFNSLTKHNMTLNSENYPDKLIENSYCLSEIPDFQGLLPKSYDAGVPIFELTDSEISEVGEVLEQLKIKRDYFFNYFNDLKNEVVELMKYV